MRPNYPTILANPITKGQQGVGQPKYTHLPKWGKDYHNLSTWVPVLNIQGPQRTASPRHRPNPETPTLRQALLEQTRLREGNPILPPDFFQFRYSTSYSMDPHALFKESNPQSVATAPLLKGVGGKMSKSGLYTSNSGPDRPALKNNGIRPCPLTYQWYHVWAQSGSDTPIPIYPELRTPTYPI